MLKGLAEIWMKAGSDCFLPSYPFGIGKKAWLLYSKKVAALALEGFAEDGSWYQITKEVTDQARELLVVVYKSQHDAFAGSSLATVGVYIFFNDIFTLLKLLPPSEGAFVEHLKRAARAVIIDKTAHISKPNIPPLVEYGWMITDGKVEPVPSKEPTWPVEMTKTLSCGCTKGCIRNCSCARNNIACRCHGSVDSCSRAKYNAAVSETIPDTDN